MHCPQCGHQFSVEVRFCKSCGFSLDPVRELLDPTAPTLEKGTRVSRSRSRMGLYRGVIILSMGIALLSLGAVKGNLLPIVILVFGLMRILYALIFQDDRQRKKKQERSLPHITNQLRAATLSALPATQSIPVSVVGARRMNTAEMVHVPSVTEHTTKLLDDSLDPK